MLPPVDLHARGASATGPVVLYSGKRNGNGVGPQLCNTLERVCVDAQAMLGKEQAQRRVAVTQEALDEKMDNIRGAVTMGEGWR